MQRPRVQHHHAVGRGTSCGLFCDRVGTPERGVSHSNLCNMPTCEFFHRTPKYITPSLDVGIYKPGTNDTMAQLTLVAHLPCYDTTFWLAQLAFRNKAKTMGIACKQVPVEAHWSIGKLAKETDARQAAPRLLRSGSSLPPTSTFHAFRQQRYLHVHTSLLRGKQY